jgi:hypothetical protein
MAERFEVYQDTSSKWRWRLVAANNEYVAASGESFYSKEGAVGGCNVVKRIAPGAPIDTV